MFNKNVISQSEEALHCDRAGGDGHLTILQVSVNQVSLPLHTCLSVCGKGSLKPINHL